MSKQLPDADLVEKIWSLAPGVRISTLILSVIEANSRDSAAIVKIFLNVIVAMSRQHGSPMRLSLASLLRDAADQIERPLVRHET